MTPSGKFTYEKGYPQIFMNYEKGFETLGGDLDYHRVDALIIHQFRSKLGYTNIKLFEEFLQEMHRSGKTLKSPDKLMRTETTGLQALRHLPI
jgi:hypothetical protein